MPFLFCGEPRVHESEITDCVTALIDICENAEGDFLAWAGNADRMDLQLMMTRRAATWHRWAAELKALCLDSTVACVAQRSAGDAKALLTVDSDLALLTHCERGEETALKHYRDALDQEVPRVVRAVLQRHVDGIWHSRAHLRSLRAVTVLEHA